MLHADFFVLAIPMQERAEELAMLAFIGGLSAATGMVIVAAIALSTMICNDLIMPALLRISWLRMRSEEHTSELQSLMRISYAVFCLKKKKQPNSIVYVDSNNYSTSH